jgi:hypothetical protein
MSGQEGEQIVAMTAILQSDHPARLALAESGLMASGIPYFVHNRHFSRGRSVQRLHCDGSVRSGGRCDRSLERNILRAATRPAPEEIASPPHGG